MSPTYFTRDTKCCLTATVQGHVFVVLTGLVNYTTSAHDCGMIDVHKESKLCSSPRLLSVKHAEIQP